MNSSESSSLRRSICGGSAACQYLFDVSLGLRNVVMMACTGSPLTRMNGVIPTRIFWRPSWSPAAGKKVKEVDLPKEVLLGPITRGKELIIPDGETVLQAADWVTLLGRKKDVESTARLLKGMP